MSTGQMMMAVGAIMLFGIVGTNMRQTLSDSDTVTQTNTMTQEAIIIGRAMMDEICSKPFDAAVATAYMSGKKIVRLTDLTSCGPGYGEIYPNYSDMDDFHGSVFLSPQPGVSATSSTPRCLRNTEGYRVNCVVEYVNLAVPETKSNTVSWAKRVRLTISNRYSEDTLRISNVVAY